MNILKLLLLVVAASFAIAACDNNDGIAEKAGKALDDTVTDAGNAIEDACEDVKDAVGAKDKNC